MGSSSHRPLVAAWRIGWLAVALVAGGTSAKAQSPEAFEGLTIEKVGFEGLRRVESAAVRVVLSSREGELPHPQRGRRRRPRRLRHGVLR
ncbi:MAG: hypothetical protein HC923_11275 [Myxococcales bacterium]|nr:hypothetical protein [Myxococcales bacterium]